MIFIVWVLMVVIVYRIGFGQGRIHGFNQYADVANKELKDKGYDIQLDRVGDE